MTAGLSRVPAMSQLPLPRPVVRVQATTLEYGIARIDRSGRLSVRPVLDRLGWSSTVRLAPAVVATSVDAAATTGDDPERDTLLLRLHTETGCRRGGARGLRPRDLDETQCLVHLREKDGTSRCHPISGAGPFE
ncbi:hypothetical protein [Amycolatopsis sp. NPDC051372]|uniref:hypothetical protein n=1 Tax=Amycolatopsis sp. NPDC051372 TaxID=3155669 RepID=UPI0034442E2F